MTAQHLAVLHEMHTSRARLRELVQQHTDNPIIYTGSPAWRISDVLVHVAFWEVEGTKSLMAHAQRTTYVTPQLSDERVDDINARVYTQLVQLPVPAQLEYADACREAFVRAVSALDATAQSTPMMCPWHEQADIMVFLQNMYGHEYKHLNDVLAALKVSA